MSKKDVTAIESGAGFIGSLAYKLIKSARQKGISDEQIHELVREGETSDEIIDQIVDALFNIRSSEYLRCISVGEVLILDECDGSEGLVDATDIFVWIDSNFENDGADQKGKATGKTPVVVHEMTKDATFAQMFGSLNADVGKLCLTPHQIKNFVRKFRKWLRINGWATFFPFESNNELFVAIVHFYPDGGLRVLVDRFGYLNVWDAGRRHRVVVPQL